MNLEIDKLKHNTAITNGLTYYIINASELDDLFQESDIAYAEEAIERETNNGGIKMNKNNDIEKYNQFAEKRRKEIENKINPSYYGTGFDVIDFCQKNNLDFMQGNVIKYVTRYKEKNGKEDLLKARKYIDRIIKEKYKED